MLINQGKQVEIFFRLRALSPGPKTGSTQKTFREVYFGRDVPVFGVQRRRWVGRVESKRRLPFPFWHRSKSAQNRGRQQHPPK
jgi:hypothetical protein